LFVLPLSFSGHRKAAVVENNRRSDIAAAKLEPNDTKYVLVRMAGLAREAGIPLVVHVPVFGKGVDPQQAKDMEEWIQTKLFPKLKAVSLHDPATYRRGAMTWADEDKKTVLLGNVYVAVQVGVVAALCQGKLFLPATMPRYKRSVLGFVGVTCVVDDGGTTDVDDGGFADDDGFTDDDSVGSVGSEDTNGTFGSATASLNGEEADVPPFVTAPFAKKQKAESEEAMLALQREFSVSCSGLITVDYKAKIERITTRKKME